MDVTVALWVWPPKACGHRSTVIPAICHWGEGPQGPHMLGKKLERCAAQVGVAGGGCRPELSVWAPWQPLGEPLQAILAPALASL